MTDQVNEAVRDREADRKRFSDPDFNRWLDEVISDAGHTVWCAIGDTQAAWAGWENRQWYTHPSRGVVDEWTAADNGDYDRSIHNNPSAEAWADLFVATFPGLADKHDLMRGWFANAMMAMHDHLHYKAQAAALPAVPEVDLEQFRRPVTVWRALAEIGVFADYMPHHFRKPADEYSARVKEADRLLAIINAATPAHDQPEGEG